jgi:hypothetical protein
MDSWVNGRWFVPQSLCQPHTSSPGISALPAASLEWPSERPVANAFRFAYEDSVYVAFNFLDHFLVYFDLHLLALGRVDFFRCIATNHLAGALSRSPIDTPRLESAE